LLYKIGKKLFEIFKNLTNLTRVLLVFFTFFMITYWIFEIAGSPFVAGLAPFFNSVNDFVHIFYNRTTTVDSVQLDYSFLILGITLLIIVWFLKFFVELIEDVEKKYDSYYKKFKKKTEELFNINLERSYVSAEHKNNNFAMIIKFSARNLAKDKFYDLDTQEGTEERQKKALDEFLDNASKILVFEKKVFGDGVMLYFTKVKNIDKILILIIENIESITTKNKEDKWEVFFSGAIEAYSSEKDIIDRCKNLLMLIKLNIKNEILCLSTFKQRYSLESNQQFFTEAKGVYTIHAEEDVYCIKNKAKYIKHV